MEKISFTSEGVKCAAYLGIPEAKNGATLPAIVLGHGFGVRKESMLFEAEYLTAAGFLTLAIDYRTVGESEGEPRGTLYPYNFVEDFRNAITFIQRRADVDANRIGIWGASFTGGVAMMTTALDRRVRAVVAMAPVVNGRRWLSSAWGGSRYEILRDIVEADRIKRYETGIGGRMPVAGPDMPAVVPTDERGMRRAAQIMADEGRPLLTSTPELTIASVEKVLEWAPDRFIELISPRPLLIVTPGEWDVLHPFDQIREAFARAGEPKKLVALPCEQMDVYCAPWQERATEHAAAWFKEHLSAG